MSRICYVPKKFQPASLDIIASAVRICEHYAKQGYTLTLRGIYYKFIAQDLLPESWVDPVYNSRNGLPPDTKNTVKNYKHLGDILNDARLAGLLDWNHMDDNVRALSQRPHWTSPKDILNASAQQFAIDKWAGQDYYVEVWVEKDAQVGVVQRAARALDLGHFACRGYVSQSEMHAAALRMMKHVVAGREVRIIHLGDHDPSGVDMTRDIENRIGSVFGCANFGVDRIALTMAQVKQYNPPPNPAKTTDARAAAYIEEYGEDSWELDALEPATLEALIYDAVKPYRDDALFAKLKEREDEMRAALQIVYEDAIQGDKRWPSIYDFLTTLGKPLYRTVGDVGEEEVLPRVHCCNENCEFDGTDWDETAEPCEGCLDLGWVKRTDKCGQCGKKGSKHGQDCPHCGWFKCTRCGDMSSDGERRRGLCGCCCLRGE